MAFSGGLKRCCKLDRISNDAIRKKLQVFNLNEKFKDYKLQWKNTLKNVRFQADQTSLEIQIYRTQVCR